MKLLFCDNCNTIFNLTNKIKKCQCGKVKGKYLDNHKAIYYGECAVPIGINNHSFYTAVRKSGNRNDFSAFVVKRDYTDFLKINESK